MNRLRVALTFDTEHPDRPARADATVTILDVLAAHGVRSTFFVQGRWAEAQPTIARRIANAGHVIGNHSHYHARMPLLTDEGLLADVADAETAIERASGVSPRPWFRAPFGAGAADARVSAALAAAGYRHVGWHVDVRDWDPAHDAALVTEGVVGAVLAHGDGAVVLLHAWPTTTADAIEGIVGRLTAAGASLTGIDELHELPEGVPS